MCFSSKDCYRYSECVKLKKAAKQTGIKQIAIGGGVSANSALQKAVHDEAARSGWEVFIASGIFPR